MPNSVCDLWTHNLSAPICLYELACRLQVSCTITTIAVATFGQRGEAKLREGPNDVHFILYVNKMDWCLASFYNTCMVIVLLHLAMKNPKSERVACNSTPISHSTLHLLPMQTVTLMHAN